MCFFTESRGSIFCHVHSLMDSFFCCFFNAYSKLNKILRHQFQWNNEQVLTMGFVSHPRRCAFDSLFSFLLFFACPFLVLYSQTESYKKMRKKSSEIYHVLFHQPLKSRLWHYHILLAPFLSLLPSSLFMYEVFVKLILRIDYVEFYLLRALPPIRDVESCASSFPSCIFSFTASFASVYEKYKSIHTQLVKMLTHHGLYHPLWMPYR